MYHVKAYITALFIPLLVPMINKVCVCVCVCVWGGGGYRWIDKGMYGDNTTACKSDGSASTF